MSKSALDALYTSYSTAIEGGDYDAAIAALLRMQALLDSTPDIVYGFGAGQNSARFRPSQIPALIAECRRLKAAVLAAASGPFQQTKITYVRPTS